MTARRASLMVTCLGDLFFPDVGMSIVRVLRRLGVAVDVPAGQTCCGLPLFNSGYHADAAAVPANLLRRAIEVAGMFEPHPGFAATKQYR